MVRCLFQGAASPRGLVLVHRGADSSPTLAPLGHSIDHYGSLGLAFESLLPQASVLVAAPWGMHSPAELALVSLLTASPRRDPLVFSSVESFNSCSTFRHHTGDPPVTRLTTFRLSVGSAEDWGPCETPTSGEEATNSSLSSAPKPVLAHPRRQSLLFQAFAGASNAESTFPIRFLTGPVLASSSQVTEISTLPYDKTFRSFERSI